MQLTFGDRAGNGDDTVRNVSSRLLAEAGRLVAKHRAIFGEITGVFRFPGSKLTSTSVDWEVSFLQYDFDPSWGKKVGRAQTNFPPN